MLQVVTLSRHCLGYCMNVYYNRLLFDPINFGRFYQVDIYAENQRIRERYQNCRSSINKLVEHNQYLTSTMASDITKQSTCKQDQ